MGLLMLGTFLRKSLLSTVAFTCDMVITNRIVDTRHTCMCTYTHINIHICTYKNIYTYTHTHTGAFNMYIGLNTRRKR